MEQMAILPVKLMYEEPYYGGTAAMRAVGFTQNRIRYALKRETDAKLLPLSEWIGYKLCEFCNILTPDYAVVECLNGELAFGSRWEESSKSVFDEPMKFNFVVENFPEMSRTHALDKFYGNIDRHCGNYLTTERLGQKVLLSMDFSHAGPSAECPFGPQPLPEGCNTLDLISKMTTPPFNYFDKKNYGECKHTLGTITKHDFEQMIEHVPEQWFSAISREDILQWWDNDLDNRKLYL